MKVKLELYLTAVLKYKGNSLNQNLLSGPDLTNQLISVLHKFRLKPVAFTVDIQAMYYQVKVPESQKSYLKYFWWKGDINPEIADHEIFLRLFGAASSLSSSNYALERTAVDSSIIYDVDASETVTKSFYVDGLPKSVGSEKYAVGLIKRVD